MDLLWYFLFIRVLLDFLQLIEMIFCISCLINDDFHCNIESLFEVYGDKPLFAPKYFVKALFIVPVPLKGLEVTGLGGCYRGFRNQHGACL